MQLNQSDCYYFWLIINHRCILSCRSLQTTISNGENVIGWPCLLVGACPLLCILNQCISPQLVQMCDSVRLQALISFCFTPWFILRVFLPAHCRMCQIESQSIQRIRLAPRFHIYSATISLISTSVCSPHLSTFESPVMADSPAILGTHTQTCTTKQKSHWDTKATKIDKRKAERKMSDVVPRASESINS